MYFVKFVEKNKISLKENKVITICSTTSVKDAVIVSMLFEQEISG